MTTCCPVCDILLSDGRFYRFDIDDERETVRVLAVFFGGEDHIRHMLVRLLDG